MVSIFEQAANFLFVFHSWTIFITRKLSIQLKIKKVLLSFLFKVVLREISDFFNVCRSQQVVLFVLSDLLIYKMFRTQF